MAFPCKCTMIFSANKFGWSESWYRNADSLSQAKTATLALAEKRRLSLSQQGVIEGIRCVNVLFPRQVDSSAPYLDQPQNTAAVGNRDINSAARLFRVFADGGHAMSWWLRGVADDMVKYDSDGKEVFTAMYVNNINPFLNALIDLQQGWQFRALSQLTTDTQPKQIATIAVLGTFQVQFTIPGHTIIAGQRFNVQRCQGANVSQFNGVWIAGAVAGDVITCTPRRATSEQYIYQSQTGVAKKRVYVYPKITDIDGVRWGSRRTGRPFGVPLGRRRGRR